MSSMPTNMPSNMPTNFFETVRVHERKAFQNLPTESRWQAVIGMDVLPEEEKLRFRSNYSLSYAATAVIDGGKFDTEDYKTLLVNFLQIAGAEGTLPQHYTKLIISRIKHKDYALADFIDMFHHRLVSLFYRGWAKYRLVPQLEAHRLANKSDPVSDLIDALAANQTAQRVAQRYYAGHFSKQIRSGRALETMLIDFLRRNVGVEEHIGSWIALNDRNLSKLTNQPEKSVRLGQGILIGRRAWSVQSKIAVHIRDLDHDSYRSLMPGTERFEALKHLIRNYVPHHISIDLFFYIHAEQVRIGFRDKPQLAKSAWLYSQPKQILKAKASIK